MMNQVYLNGKLLPIEQAQISVLDRGFLLGDGVYEVIPAFGGKLFRLEQHLQRLDNSLSAVRIPNPHTHSEWQKILQQLITSNDNDLSIYLQVTRGVAPKRDHAFPDKVIPTVFAMSNIIPEPDPATLEKGVNAITLDDIRWKRCDIKAITLLANVVLRQEAHDHNAAEAILIRDGQAMEGAASNLFIVSADTIYTPPKGPQLLPGVTRDLILELSREHGLTIEERNISEQSLNNAQEIWLTSSTREILPVTQLNGNQVGNGRPGKHWQQMIQLYRDYKKGLR